MSTEMRFVSLNGPDNAGKTTHLRLLAERWPTCHLLGSVHEYDPEPWARVAAGDYATWWFEKSSTSELTAMLVASHLKRAAVCPEGRTGLLDRGLPMLLAAAGATCAVKDHRAIDDALRTVTAIATPMGAAPETAVLLLPSVDPERSYAITSSREGRPWTGIYPEYQRALHQALLQQAEQGVYDSVVDCEGRSIDDIHAEITNAVRPQGPGRIGATRKERNE